MNRRVILGLVLLLLVPGLALSQELTGKMTGTVKDQQDLVIPGAAVTATHVATNTVYRATTTAVGRFLIPAARLGRYRVVVESPGFRRAIVENVVVQVGSVADINVKLEVGELTSEVTVSADVSQEIINTADAELGATVNERQVLELPLNGRNAAELIFLQAGAFYETDQDGRGRALHVHGMRHRAVNITLDGVDTQDNRNRATSIMINQPLIALAAENVQEFRVSTGISSAEQTRGGIQVNAVTRSGSNQFHGSLFEFHRNTVFNANNWFNNRDGVERPKLIRNQFGGRIGGPIIEDKLWFFFGYQQTREVRGIPEQRTTFTDSAKQGLFSWIDSSGAVATVNLLDCSPLVMAINGDECLADNYNRTNFPNLIVGNNITPDPFISANLLPAFPQPNSPGGDGFNTGGFRFNSNTSTFEHLPSFRLDYRINAKHLFYGTINYLDRFIDGDFINNRQVRFPGLPALGLRTTLSKTFTGAVVSTFTPTLVNEARVGWLGGENAFPVQQPFTTLFTLNFDNVTDPFSPGDGAFQRDNVTMHVRDSLSWSRGSHQIKFGGEWRFRTMEDFDADEAFDYGSIDFDDADNPPGFSSTELQRMATTPGCTPAPGAPCASSRPGSTDFNNAEENFNAIVGAIGEVQAQFNVNDISRGFDPTGTALHRKFLVRELDFWFNDTWQFRKNLTLNLGLRWEWSGIPIETRGLSLIPEGGEDAVFGVSGRDGFGNPGVFNGSPCPELANIPIANPTAADATALILGCATKNVLGGSNNGRPFFDNDFNNFGPVVSVAWDPFGSGKTSVRAGYRISYIQDHFLIIEGNIDDNEGLSVDQDCEPLAGDCSDPNASALLRDYIDGGGNAIAPPGLVAAAPAFALPAIRTSQFDSDAQDFRTYEKNLGTQYYHEWTFGIQRELSTNWALEARYVGTLGRNLRRVADFNEYNLNVLDPASGQTFLQAFIAAQSNLACNRANGSSSFADTTGFACITANPLMATLLAGDPGLFTNSTLRGILDENQTGDFIDEVVNDRRSSVGGGGRLDGGTFFGAVLRGDLPLNFFSANPFVASSRRMVGDGFSNYHALEVEFRRRPVGGFAFQANYTYQRAIADYTGNSNTLLNDVRPSSARDPRSTIQEIMPRQQVHVNWLYELPFGKGKRWTAAGNAMNRVIGGWQISGIINWRTGRPDGIFSGVGTFHREAISGANTVNLSTNVSGSQITDLTGQQTIVNPSTGLAGLYWLDPCLSSQQVGSLTGGSCSSSSATQGLFTLPNPGEIGKVPQTIIFGPRLFNLDFGLLKRTTVTETVDVEFRWEVFNAFNNPNFARPNTSIFSSTFGQITSVNTFPRLMQFALKVNF